VDEQKGHHAMNAQALVHHLVAAQLHIEATAIEDAQTFDELGLDPLDLVLVVIRLDHLDRGDGNFPVAALDDAKTIRDLVALVDVWVHGDTFGQDARH
jgi:acyl carrier protein